MKVQVRGIPVLVLVAVLAACSSNTDSRSLTGHGAGEAAQEQTRVVSWPGYAEEYRVTVKSLAWPKGVEAPSTPPIKPEAANFEVGLGEGDAVAAWNCAWGKRYLSLRGKDTTGAASALKQYAAIRSTHAWDKSYSDPNTRQTVNQSISQAQLGDPALLQSLVKANCR
jgi:hypothetical protein